jgi:hypothetical protein
MSGSIEQSTEQKVDRIDVTYGYGLCVWARHFNTSERQVKEAVAAVGDRADKVREHLKSKRQPSTNSERPSSY